MIGLVSLFIIFIAPNPMDQLACLEEAQLIKHFINHQTSVKHLNHMLKLRHDGIKLLLSQKCLTNFSWIELAWRSISGNNSNIKYRKCSILSSSFSTCTYLVYQKRPAKNYKTLHRLVFLEKLSKRATRRPAEDTISRHLLQKVIYSILLLLPTMQRLFWYCRYNWVKSHPICCLFSL